MRDELMRPQKCIMDLYAYPLLLLALAALFTREVIAPASRNRCDRRWLIMSTALGAFTVVIAIGIGLVFREAIIRRALWPLPAGTPDVLVGTLSFFITSFIFYWWHRATHRFDGLWRSVHQLHHSATRIESLTAFYAHPLDTAAATLLGCFASYVILGASSMAAAWALLLTGLFDLYLHADLHTPYWVGYIVQRPEMHRVHHAYGHHAQNYGLPVWDMLFGTWHNPREWVARCGFDDDKSAQIYAMLIGQDVHKAGAPTPHTP
jgi:sterol desaturase/sphingolipid hydroxylase (fatty acid hydroxylase superfamily)